MISEKVRVMPQSNLVDIHAPRYRHTGCCGNAGWSCGQTCLRTDTVSTNVAAGCVREPRRVLFGMGHFRHAF